MDDDINEQSAPISPHFRIWLCGAFRVERRVGTTYEGVRTAEWGGSSYPRLLLKALLCCPGRQARREALIEMLWPETDPDLAVHYLNTATTKLRTVFRHAKGQDSFLVTENDSTLYRLAGQPVLWVDADEGVALLKEAEQRGRTLPEALPLLEEAADYFNKGAFLQEDEGFWVAGRRATVEQIRYRCRLWLAEAYTQQGMPGHAEMVLSSLVEEDPFDEDMLCRLMELLQSQGMTHQALRLYHQTRQLFAQEHIELTEATKAFATHLQEKRSSLVRETFFIEHKDQTGKVRKITPSKSDDGIQAITSELSSRPWTVPYPRNPFFTGREDLLTSLHTRFLTKEQFGGITQHALCGLGGIGKTQLALEYAYRYQQEYQAIFWIKADTQENILTDMVALASLLSLPNATDPNYSHILVTVKQWFQSHEHWLLILDNADDLTLVSEFLPTGHHGHVLFTTRSQAVGRLAIGMPIEEMDQYTGSLFLLRRAGLLPREEAYPVTASADYVLAQRLVQEVGGLPLALDQAGAYIEETSSQLQEYLDLYHAYRPILLRRRGGVIADHPESVATTWALAFAYIEQSAPLAADILRLCAFLDPDTIPEEILLVGMQKPFAPTDIDQIQFGEAIGSLLRFSLVRRNIETRTLTIHRLVQVILQQTMEKEIRQQWSVRTAQAIYQAFPQASKVYSSSGYPFRAVQRLTASILLYQNQEKKENLAYELWNLAVQQQVVGQLSASERNLQDCLTLCQEHHDTFNQAKAHQYVALLRTYQGDFSAASRHLSEALSLFQDAHAVSEEGIVWAYCSLCAILSGNATLASESARRAWECAKEQNVDRDLIRAQWLLGWSAIQRITPHSDRKKDFITEAHRCLQNALDQCRHSHMVDYEADLWLAWARLCNAQGKSEDALASANKALTIADRAHFRLLRADIHTVLAQIFLPEDQQRAERHAHIAIEAATCEGSPYWYVPALLQAKQILSRMQPAIEEKGSCG